MSFDGSFHDRAAAGLGGDFSFQLLGRDCILRAMNHRLIQSFNIYDYCSVPDTARDYMYVIMNKININPALPRAYKASVRSK